MSARVIYIEKVRQSIAAAKKMHDSDEAAIAQAYIKLVYCMAAWNGEPKCGVRSGSPGTCRMRAAHAEEIPH